MFNKRNFILYCEIEIEFIAEDMVNVRIRLRLAEIRNGGKKIYRELPAVSK